MHKTTLGFCFFVTITLLFAGCPALHSSPPVVVKISIDQPGFPPEDMEMEICDITKMAILSASDVKAITFVSFEGHADIYVESEPNINNAEFMTKIESAIKQTFPVLPADAKLIGITKVNRKDIPTEDIIKEVDTKAIKINREKTASLGIKISDIVTAIRRTVEAKQPLDDVVLEAIDGKKVKLLDVVTIKNVREPNCRISYWPPKNTDK